MNDNEEKQLRIKQSNDKQREELYQQLEAHLNENKKKNSTLVDELQKQMEAQYQEMRRKAKITADNEHSDGSDFQTEQDFRKLRPNAGYKLMDLLTGRVKEPKRKMFRKKGPPATCPTGDPRLGQPA